MKGRSHGAASAATETTTAASAATETTTAASAATPTTTAASAATIPSIDTSRQSRVVAIVGGGFSGVSLAIHLLRQPATTPTRIVIYEPRAELGAGVAYATRDYPYPLYVAAGQMSLDASSPSDFLDFARALGIAAAAGDYLPRQLYGEYLRARFDRACATAPPQLRAQHCRARVLQLGRTSDDGWELSLDDGSAQRADEVVLALGNPPPASLPPLQAIAGSLFCVDDPWSLGSCAHGNIGDVLLVGSGLTMIDAALRLAAFRPRVRHIHVLSRHGLLPEPQASEVRATVKPDLQDLLAQGSARRLVRVARRVARTVQEADGSAPTCMASASTSTRKAASSRVTDAR